MMSSSNVPLPVILKVGYEKLLTPLLGVLDGKCVSWAIQLTFWILESLEAKWGNSCWNIINHFLTGLLRKTHKEGFLGQRFPSFTKSTWESWLNVECSLERLFLLKKSWKLQTAIAFLILDNLLARHTPVPQYTHRIMSHRDPPLSLSCFWSMVCRRPYPPAGTGS